MYQIKEHGLSIAAPADWKGVEFEPGMVWHVGTDMETLVSVSIKINSDPSMALMSNEKYWENMTKDRFVSVMRVLYAEPEINFWQTNYPFAGGRALHAVYSGRISETKMTVLIIQTVRNGKLYTLNCQAISPEFHKLYSRTFLRIADSMKFD